MTNYTKGRAKEYKIKKLFEEEGWTVLRTAGSHGFADLIAINKPNKEIFFIQVKPVNYSPANTKKLETENQDINGKYKCKFILMT